MSRKSKFKEAKSLQLQDQMSKRSNVQKTKCPKDQMSTRPHVSRPRVQRPQVYLPLWVVVGLWSPTGLYSRSKKRSLYFLFSCFWPLLWPHVEAEVVFYDTIWKLKGLRLVFLGTSYNELITYQKLANSTYAFSSSLRLGTSTDLYPNPFFLHLAAESSKFKAIKRMTTKMAKYLIL